jgi:hypothetical protein
MAEHQEFGTDPRTTTRLWSRYGHKRLYVNVDGEQVGYWDVIGGKAIIADPGHSQATEHFAAIESEARSWLARREKKAESSVQTEDSAGAPISTAVPPPPPSQGVPAEPASPVLPPAQPNAPASHTPPADRGRDLSLNKAGDGVREMARAKFRQAPLSNLAKRLMGRQTGDDWTWRQGIRGEQQVGRALDNAIARTPGWFVLHGITRNARGTDVDHLLIGSGGIFSINAKFHEGKRVWVGEHVIGVGGKTTDHLRDARSEAKKVKKLLDAAYPTPHEVTPVVVVAGSSSFSRGKKVPSDVVVLHVSGIAKWLGSLGEKIRPWEVEELYGVARWERTWVQP